MHLRLRRRLRSAGDAGVVGANLAITLAFALFAVIQLSRTISGHANSIDCSVTILDSQGCER
ncbi:MAG: hypothetical protein ACRD03_06940 [Acidimicrobiales bacterium]